MWAIIKPWIHPITQAKINIHGGMSDAVKKMNEAGIDNSAIPELMKGTCKPKSTLEYMLEVIEDRKQKQQQAGNDDDGDENASTSAKQGEEAEPEKVADDLGHLAVV